MPVEYERRLRSTRWGKIGSIASFALGALVLAVSTSSPARAADAGLAPLSTSGNHIIRAGSPFNFYGVNRDTLEWGEYNWGGCGGDGHFTASDFDRIAAWHVSAVRIPLSEADWLGRRCAGVDYRGLVDAAVAAANARGMYAILDLHWNDVGGLAPCDQGCLSGQQPMPDADSAPFWSEVGARYANQPGVIFDLFNEPHGVSWACWRSGGCTVTSSTAGGSGSAVSYTAVGMQTLLDMVRATGADNLVLAAGLDWAYDLSGVINGFALAGANVAYDSHIYVQWHNTAADWDSHVGMVTKAYPVTVTELGSTDCSTIATAPLLRYLSAPMGILANRVSWTVWSWSAPGDCTQPSLIADWSGTPLNGQGALVHDQLAALAGSAPGPSGPGAPAPGAPTPGAPGAGPTPVAAPQSSAPPSAWPAPQVFAAPAATAALRPRSAPVHRLWARSAQHKRVGARRHAHRHEVAKQRHPRGAKAPWLN